MELAFLLLLWGQSDPRTAELREMPQSFSIKLHSEIHVSGRLGMSRGCPKPLIERAKDNALDNPPCPIIPSLTSSSVHCSSHQLTKTFLSYYNVTKKIICAEKSSKAMIYYYFYLIHLTMFHCHIVIALYLKRRSIICISNIYI